MRSVRDRSPRLLLSLDLRYPSSRFTCPGAEELLSHIRPESRPDFLKSLERKRQVDWKTRLPGGLLLRRDGGSPQDLRLWRVPMRPFLTREEIWTRWTPDRTRSSTGTWENLSLRSLVWYEIPVWMVYHVPLSFPGHFHFSRNCSSFTTPSLSS